MIIMIKITCFIRSPRIIWTQNYSNLYTRIYIILYMLATQEILKFYTVYQI